MTSENLESQDPSKFGLVNSLVRCVYIILG